MRDIRFTFLMNQLESDLLHALSYKHLRSSSDVVRVALRRLAKVEGIGDPTKFIEEFKHLPWDQRPEFGDE